jgi:sodium pump decarboxylase gamma subunit
MKQRGETKMKDSLNLTFVGLTVVFLALILLLLIISAFSRIFNVKKQKQVGHIDKDDMESIIINEEYKGGCIHPEKVNTDEELIIVITAAVLAAMGSRPEVKIKVKSFSRVKNSRPSWNEAGLREQIQGKL